MWIKKLQEQQNRWGNLLESPTWRFIREFNEREHLWRNLFDSPALRFMREFDEKQRYRRNLFDFSTFSFEREFHERLGHLGNLFDSPTLRFMKELQQQHNHQFNLTQLSALRAISEETLNYLDRAFSGRNFLQTSLGQLLNSLNFIHGRFEPEAIEEDAFLIERYFEEKSGELDPDIISFEGMLNIWISILLFVLSIYYGNQSEKHIIDIILQSEERILKNIEEIKPKKGTETYYFVLRTVNLRSKPNTKSPKIGTLYPNQKVTLIRAKRKWIYVKYFDYIEGIPKTGWVFKKYLKRLK